MEKTLQIDDKQVKFKATAAIPRLYRIKFRRDILQDLGRLKSAYAKAVNEDEQFSVTDLEMFENCAYIMAKHADQSTPSTVEEWLDNFETFSIYMILPEILELWMLNEETIAESKKKLNQAAGS